MAEARRAAGWQIASNLMWIIYQCNRDPKRSRSLKPSDFDPTVKGRDEVLPGSIDDLKVFLRGPVHPRPRENDGKGEQGANPWRSSQRPRPSARPTR